MTGQPYRRYQQMTHIDPHHVHPAGVGPNRPAGRPKPTGSWTIGTTAPAGRVHLGQPDGTAWCRPSMTITDVIATLNQTASDYVDALLTAEISTARACVRCVDGNIGKGQYDRCWKEKVRQSAADPADTVRPGDPDPTQGSGADCPAEHNGLLCTREAGHAGQHVAGDFHKKVAGVWPNEPAADPAPVVVPAPMTDSTNERDSIVTGLRELADFLEANPALNHPGLGNFSAQISHLNPTFNERSAAVDADAAVMGVTATNPTGDGNYVAKRMFGRRVELCSVAIRPGVIKGLDDYTPPAEPVPAEMDRTHPDGVKVGDPVPDGIDPGCHPMNQCRVNSPSSAAGWHRCDRSDAKHVTGGGQHVALGPANANGTGDLVVVAVWPAGTGWTSL